MSCRIELFGGLRVWVDDRLIDRFSIRTTTAVLPRLAFYPGRPQARDELMDIFWPEMDQDSARNNLRQAICTLRRSLESAGLSAEIILADRSTVRLAPDV